MKTTIEQIRVLGFSQYEAKLIEVLLETDQPTAKDIAQITAVPKNKVYELLEKLQEQSVVEALPVKPKRFRLLDFAAYMQTHAATQQQALADATKSLEKIIPKKKHSAEDGREVWATEGSEAMLTKINSVLNHTQKESIAFIDVWVESNENYALVKKALNKGVKFYFLGPKTAAAKPTIKKYLKLGVSVREYPVESAGYSVFDSSFVQMRTSSEKIISVWIQNDYLAQIMREHFFHCWKKSKKMTI